MSPLIKNALIATIVITVLFFGYTYLMPSGEDVPALETQGVATGGGDEGRDFLLALVNLRKIDLRIADTVFKNETFVNLRDMSVGLPGDAKGRPNPFKPIGEDAASPASSGAATIPTNPTIPNDFPSDSPGF